MELEEEEFFETSAPLLNSFLNLRDDMPCRTLRYLDIPWPVGERWKWIPVPRYNSWEWVNSWEFDDRVFATFPNVVNHNARRDAWRSKRVQDKYSKFREQGKELGLLVEGEEDWDVEALLRMEKLFQKRRS